MAYGLGVNERAIAVSASFEVIVEVNTNFLDHQGDISEVDTVQVIQEMSVDIFKALELAIKEKKMINFQTDAFGNHEVQNPKRTYIYLKAIDKALREFKEAEGRIPGVGMFLAKAGITDEMMTIITQLVQDRLLGAMDTDLHGYNFVLNKNKLTSSSLHPFALAILNTDVFAVDFRGNEFDHQTVTALKTWQNAPFPMQTDDKGGILNLNQAPRTLKLFQGDI